MPYPRLEVKVYTRKSKKSKIPPLIEDTDTAAKVFRDCFNLNTILWVEEVLLLCLNKANRLIGWRQVAIGGLDSVVFDFRVIATIALGCTATSVILAHNHPSCNLIPSKADIEYTRHIGYKLEDLGIRLTDHLILTNDSHLSMKQHGFF